MVRSVTRTPWALAAVLTAITLAGTPTRAEPLETRAQSVVVKHRAASDVPTLGPAHAPVTIDFFVALRSGRSLLLHERLLQLHQRHPRRVRIIYRLVGASGGTYVSEAAMEAFTQGRFLPFMAELNAHRDALLPHRKAKLADACRRAGLDFQRVEDAWSTEKHLDVLARNNAYRYQRHADRVPSLLFNGKPLSRARRIGISDLEAEYDRAHTEAQGLLDDGVPLEQLYLTALRRIDASRETQSVRPGAIDGGRAADVSAAMRRAPLLASQALGKGNARGPEDAAVTLLFYCNFASSHCMYLKRRIDEIGRNYPRRLRLVFYPMVPESYEGDQLRDVLLLHRGALCADYQGAFWRFYHAAYDVLFERRRRSSRPLPGSSHIDIITSRIELDAALFTECIERPEQDELLLDRVRAGRKAGIQHSPTVVIGGRIYPGSRTEGDLRYLIEQELAPGLLERLLPSFPLPSFERDPDRP